MKLWKGIATIAALVVVNLLVNLYVVRWDMTDDHRYSIAPTTKQLLQTLDEPLEVTILLDGELNTGFQRLQRATIELLEEFQARSENTSIRYRVSTENIPQGIPPTVIHERTHKGQTAQTTVYPFALLHYKGQSSVV